MRTGLSLILFTIFLALHLAVRTVGAQEGGQPTTPAQAIHVNANESVLLDTDFNIRRVSVAKPETADVLVISPRQLLIIGKLQGTTSLVYWSDQEVPKTAEIIVGINLDRVRHDLAKIAPDESFELTASGNALIISGPVSSSLVQSRIVESAKTYGTPVVDLLKVVKLEQV